ncbi:MAG: PP2C family protein-serine/threonine phosphatase [Anaerolineales bacterium]|nr:PP2C family protein-serine/threonine phosphatase [Anaerolineales bacterium]
MLLETQLPQLQQLASLWQARGAHALCLCQDDHVVWQSPAAPACRPDLLAPIPLEGGPPVALGIAGRGDAAAHQRLAADAQLLGHAATLEYELQLMTAELIETQDQLLALYNLTQSNGARHDVAGTIAALVAKIAGLVRVENVFAVLEAPPEWPHLIVRAAPPLLADDAICALARQAEAAGGELLLQAETAESAPLPPAIHRLLLLSLAPRDDVRVCFGFVNKQLGSFQSPDLKLMRAIAEQAGAQIENALLLHESVNQARLQTEMQLAQEVQLQLLPRQAPRIPGLDLYAASLPALQVGGDFYDFIAEPQRPFTFTVGDVSGKGVSSALLMTMIRTVIRGAARFDTTPSPQAILDRANRHLYDDFTEVMMFATVFVAQYDPRARRLTYANAGHSPVIHCPAGRGATLLEADGTAVGVLPDNLAQNQHLAFGPGDVLVVATDGFSEARHPDGTLFGYDRLLRLVRDNAARPAADIAAALYTAVSDFATGHPQDDDQTLIVVKGIQP